MNTLVLVVAATLGSVSPQQPATVDPQDPRTQPGQPGQPDPSQVPRQLMTLPGVPACRRGDHRIDIDGSLVDWPQLPVIELGDVRQLSGTANGAWRSVADLSAQAFLMWDDTDLYFAAVVKDEWHRPLDPKSFTLLETPVADSIVLTIDPLRNTRSLGPDPGRNEDVEFWLGDEASHEVLQWDRLRGAAQLLGVDPENPDRPPASRIVVSHDKEKSLTTYEMRVAWSTILPPGQTAKAGRSFDLQVVVNDFDEGTDPMPQTRIGWTFGCSVAADTCLLGTVVLVDDDGQLAGGRPEMPARQQIEPIEVLRREHWLGFVRQLRAHPPTVHDGTRAPEEAGGIARLELLEHLDYELARYPRVDYVEFCERGHRQMAREVTAAEQFGIPSFWDIAARTTAKAAAEPALPGTYQVYRLPQNGWLVRGQHLGFMVDPAAARAAALYWGATDFVLLSEPLDMARRNDPLLMRMVDAKPQRPFFAHIAFHLPRLLMADMPLVTPGDSRLQSDGGMVHALGEQRPDGKVPFALGYQVDLPGKIKIVFAGAALRVEDLRPDAKGCQCLILTARNAESIAIAQAVEPRLVLIDGAFECHQLPDVDRVDLRMAHTMQKVLLPTPSLLLAPGESWEIARGP